MLAHDDHGNPPREQLAESEPPFFGRDTLTTIEVRNHRMDDRNPYAPSLASLQFNRAGTSDNAAADNAIWRDGDVLIKLSRADMPLRCVKCNAAADKPVRTVKVYWHHPLIYLLVVINLLIYAIVAAIVREKAFVNAGLCKEHKKRRSIAMASAWTGALGGIALMFFGMGSSWGFWGALVGVLLIFGSIIAGLIFARTVYAKRIDGRYVRLKGCGTAFLDSLPPFPGEPG